MTIFRSGPYHNVMPIHHICVNSLSMVLIYHFEIRDLKKRKNQQKPKKSSRRQHTPISSRIANTRLTEGLNEDSDSSSRNELLTNYFKCVYRLPKEFELCNQQIEFLKLKDMLNGFLEVTPSLQQISIPLKINSNFIVESRIQASNQGHKTRKNANDSHRGHQRGQGTPSDPSSFSGNFIMSSKDKMGKIMISIKKIDSRGTGANRNRYLLAPEITSIELRRLKSIKNLKYEDCNFLNIKDVVQNSFYFRAKLANQMEFHVIKMLDFGSAASLSWDPIFLFLKEHKNHFQYISNFEHSQGIVKCLDYFCIFDEVEPESNPKIYLIFEDFNCTLRDLIEIRRENGRPYSERGLLEIARDVLTGLCSLQRMGLSHRNLRPENIMFSHRKSRYLLHSLNLCLSSQEEYQTQASLTGTPLYMPLETLMSFSVEDGQLFFLNHRDKSDVYSLGVILIELLNLRLVRSGILPENSFYKVITCNTLGGIQDLMSLCEQKLVFHNHLIHILDEARVNKGASNGLIYLLRAMILEGVEARISAQDALRVVEALIQESRKVMDTNESDIPFSKFISKKFLHDFEKKGVRSEADYQVCFITADFAFDIQLAEKAETLYRLAQEFLVFEQGAVRKLERLHLMYARANNLRMMGQQDQALELVEKLIDKADLSGFSKEPVYLNSVILRSNVKFIAGDLKGALSDLDLTLKQIEQDADSQVDPSNTHSKRGSILYYQIARIHSCLGNWAKSLSLVQKIKSRMGVNSLSIQSIYIEILVFELEVLIKLKLLNRAEKGLKQLINLCALYSSDLAYRTQIKAYHYLAYLSIVKGDFCSGMDYAGLANEKIQVGDSEDLCFAKSVSLVVYAIIHQSQNQGTAVRLIEEAVGLLGGKKCLEVKFREKQLVYEILVEVCLKTMQFEKAEELCCQALHEISTGLTQNHFISHSFLEGRIRANMGKLDLQTALLHSKAYFKVGRRCKDLLLNFQFQFKMYSLEPKVLKRIGRWEESLTLLDANLRQVKSTWQKLKTNKSKKSNFLRSIQLISSTTKKAILTKFW